MLLLRRPLALAFGLHLLLTLALLFHHLGVQPLRLGLYPRALRIGRRRLGGRLGLSLPGSLLRGLLRPLLLRGLRLLLLRRLGLLGLLALLLALLLPLEPLLLLLGVGLLRLRGARGEQGQRHNRPYPLHHLAPNDAAVIHTLAGAGKPGAGGARPAT